MNDPKTYPQKKFYFKYIGGIIKPKIPWLLLRPYVKSAFGGIFPFSLNIKRAAFKARKKSKKNLVEKAINNLQADFLLDDSRVSQSIRN